MGGERVGILALQGDVRAHERMLVGLGSAVVRVRRPVDVAAVDGLVIPGGESGVIDRLSRAFALQKPIRSAIADGMPVLGTCAGMILLADRIIDGAEGQETFGGLGIEVRRNAFGRQTESFEIDLPVMGMDDGPVRAVFIRAPLVTSAGKGVRVLATLPSGGVVAVQQRNLLATSFHPEATGEQRFHRLLLERIRARRASAAAPAR